MKVVVLNGSPKGKYSITLQTILYLEKIYPNCTFEVINVGQKIKIFEKDMSPAIEVLNTADLIVFAYPVYTFIAPYQLHRFIELLKEQKVELKGKYATQISTSKHFYDVTAHRYIEENCNDLGLKYIKGLSADMEDLTKEQGQKDAKVFWDYVMFSMKNNLQEPFFGNISDNEIKKKEVYNPVIIPGDKSKDYTTVIVTNCEKDDVNLKNMIEDFRASYRYNTKVINIKEYNFSGGCLGCFNCAITGKCIYKDGFADFLRNEIQGKDVSSIVFAFTIKDHSMGASFKIYDDRQFCNGHRTVTMGMPMGYIISGELSKESNLRTIIEGRCEVGHNFLAGIATDEGDTTENIKNLALKLAYANENNTVLPQNFYGVGGMKIFRDLIYIMKGFMKADHKFYKENSFYDFPQKQKGTILKMKLVGLLISNPKIVAKMGNKMTEGMLGPYKKVIDNIK